ncbi:hypothetical protein HF675_03925 [Serratia sp. JUb9]|uniref:hypothetical protein n=1 Tax=Serratia sp. JUb9 TaxID=2724469 RepID=UPI00164E1834|nr:hypothetical protein [Serratia sp. JUb9]QPT13563.1 hypothetical protein I6G37_00600 [Serratia rubidaea]QNK33222.1 hypothetical protein HF675_03925 [Serratia sp. JUb9]HDJ1442299.1 hypothetical protein [Serratia rubidaea]HDJ1451282.1 hypothetical protein [Serratia rubidaea]HDJ1464150.1 hypothetical protein [Serratia rubidaea]
MPLALNHVFEIMQFAASKPSTAREVRGILTHAYKSSLKQFTLFSGFVSMGVLGHIEDGIYKGHTIVREHHRKIQRSLTAYIKERMDGAPWDYTEFEERVKYLSEVHLTSVAENFALNRKGATYSSVGIELLRWDCLTLTQQALLHKHVLHGHVGNASEFKPIPNESHEPII